MHGVPRLSFEGEWSAKSLQYNKLRVVVSLLREPAQALEAISIKFNGMIEDCDRAP